MNELEIYLNPCLAQPNLSGQLFAYKCIWVVGAEGTKKTREMKELHNLSGKLRPYRSKIFSRAANCPLENVVRLRRGFLASASADDRI